MSLLAFIVIVGAQPHWRVCIDPGHPSEVGEGTTGKEITEIHAAWLIANGLKKRLEKEGCKVILTKSREMEVVRNRKRAEIANDFHADLAVRLHCDSSADSGYAIYYPDRKGKSAGFSGPSEGVIKASHQAGIPFHDAFKKVIGFELKDQGLLPDIRTFVGSKQGALTGSIFSTVPVLLIEMVTLTNAKDEAFMTSKEGQTKMVDALAKGTFAALRVGAKKNEDHR